MASADDLESRHKQTAAPTRKPTNPKRLCPREAVKFNLIDGCSKTLDRASGTPGIQDV
ncbi:MAG: hypothetical protein ACI8P0_006601 [Planctomycetaceae bacterium]